MTGQELYRMYREAHARQNCEVEEWVELPDDERMVWEDVAAQIREAYGV